MRPNFQILTLVLLAPLSGLAQETAPLSLLPEELHETVTEGKRLIHDIFVMDASGGNALRLTDGTSIVQEPSWSPNGQLIAFSRGTTQGLDIWVMSPDGRGSHAVTDLAGDEISPSWSADGSTIAFCSFADRPDSASIQAVSLSGGDPISLTDTSPLTEPAFSPSGDKLLVTKFLDPQPRKYNFRVSILENGTFTDIETSEGSSFLTQGSWSRNGNSIVCRANKIGLGDIGIFTLSDLSYIQLTSHPSEDRDPAFSPDGRKIVFASDRMGDFDLYTINVDGTGLQALTRSPNQDEIEPAFSPDGQKIAYTVIRLATTEEEDTAFGAGVNLPPELQTGSVLPDSKTIRLSPWRLSWAWRSAHETHFVALGVNGALVSAGVNQSGEFLALAPDGAGALLHHIGPAWRGVYARILPDGSVVREQPRQRPGVLRPPSAEYGKWPFIDEDGRVVRIPDGEVIFPESLAQGEPLTRPEGAQQWLVELNDGSFYAPNQDIEPVGNVIWVLRRGDGLELRHSGPLRQGTHSLVAADRSMQFVSASTIASEETTHYWPFANPQNLPTKVPELFKCTPQTDPESVTKVFPDGRMEFPPIPPIP